MVQQQPFITRTLLLQICKTSHLLNLWYLCQLWNLSLVSSPGKGQGLRAYKVYPNTSVVYLADLIWWFICRYFLGSCIHSRYSWALETLKQQCQHPDLRGFPRRCSTWGDRYGHKAQGTCAEHHQRRGDEGGRDIASPHEPIPPPLTLRSGREGHRAFRENDQHTEHYTPHWENEIRHMELKWQIMLIDWRLSTTEISTLLKAK